MKDANAGNETDAASPRTKSLLQQVIWFDRLRLWAVLGMVVITLVAAYGLGLGVRVGPLLGIAAITLVLNVLYRAWLAAQRTPRYASLQRHVDLQILLDLLLLVALLHYSGGVANPFLFFFLFHTFIATLVRSVVTGLRVALASMILAGVVGYLEWARIWPAPKTGLAERSIDAGILGLGVWTVAFGLTLLISVYFVGTVLRQVRTRDEELSRLSRQLGQSEKLASIGTLAAGVAHEINNPVGVIRNRTEILRYRIKDGDEASLLLAELDTIERHTRRVSSITQGLLTFSKEAPFQLEPRDLNQLAREAIELVGVPFREARVDLDAELGTRPVWIQGSGNHLLQVLVNILLNARDASDAGGRVVVRTGVDEDAWVAIEDFGAGITTDALPKIFDPFFTTKDVDRGTGLGLAISHGIVERHRGRIDVRSIPGEGSTFCVRLPPFSA